MQQNFGKDFIVLKTTSGTEAIKMLKGDSANNIKAIISDWRLFQVTPSPTGNHCRGMKF